MSSATAQQPPTVPLAQVVTTQPPTTPTQPVQPSPPSQAPVMGNAATAPNVPADTTASAAQVLSSIAQQNASPSSRVQCGESSQRPLCSAHVLARPLQAMGPCRTARQPQTLPHTKCLRWPPNEGKPQDQVPCLRYSVLVAGRLQQAPCRRTPRQAIRLCRVLQIVRAKKQFDSTRTHPYRRKAICLPSVPKEIHCESPACSICFRR